MTRKTFVRKRHALPKVRKISSRIEAFGTIDELNAWIGFVNDVLSNSKVNHIIRGVQDNLFIIGSSLACDRIHDTNFVIPKLKESDIAILEKEIDSMHETLPTINNFILPGGHASVSATHICRCVCIRAERCCVTLKIQNEPIDPLIIKYVNKLSDYLFVLARYIAKSNNVEELIWNQHMK